MANIVPAVNTLLCAIIIILGIIKYREKKDKFLLYIAAAFAIFGASHLMTLVGFSKSAAGLIIEVRIIAYIIIIFALYRSAD